MIITNIKSHGLKCMLTCVSGEQIALQLASRSFIKKQFNIDIPEYEDFDINTNIIDPKILGRKIDLKTNKTSKGIATTLIWAD